MNQENKIAFITGITEQDGAYLSKLLLQNDYKVIRLVRDSQNINDKKLNYLGITSKTLFEECYLLDIVNLINKYKPKEIHNLASQSSVGTSLSVSN